MTPPKYIKWFVAEESVVIENDIPITCYKLDYSINQDILRDWAKHIRRHYESDEELAESLRATSLTAKEYLRTYVIPQKQDVMGPSSRSNDFTEIMVSDLLEFIHGYSVPRCKQDNRSGKTSSEHGTDIIAYSFCESYKRPSLKDELMAVEVKAGLSSDSFDPIFKAVVDSQKYDEVRHAHTLNFYRKELKRKGQIQQSEEIARFQKKSEFDYILTYVAAAVISRESIPINKAIEINGQSIVLRNDDRLFLIHGKQFMQLAHDIYERCVE